MHQSLENEIINLVGGNSLIEDNSLKVKRCKNVSNRNQIDTNNTMCLTHYSDVVMGTIASKKSSLTIV